MQYNYQIILGTYLNINLELVLLHGSLKKTFGCMSFNKVLISRELIH